MRNSAVPGDCGRSGHDNRLFMEAILRWSRVFEELAKKSDLWRSFHWKYSDRWSGFIGTRPGT